MTRRALGRGLSALLGEVETTTAGLEQVLLSLIDSNPYQPRRAFPEEVLRELADSIGKHGVLHGTQTGTGEGDQQRVGSGAGELRGVGS